MEIRGGLTEVSGVDESDDKGQEGGGENVGGDQILG